MLLVLFSPPRETRAEELRIGIIDFYGLHRVSEADAWMALTFKEGETVSLESEEPPPFLEASERRLARLPHASRAHTTIVCCDGDHLIVYVGIEEKGRGKKSFRAAPRGSARLASDVLEAGEAFARAFAAAVLRGDGGEDDSQGHALCHDPTTRAVQERFIGLAARDRERLRRVLRDSSDAGQRALAAQVLGYVRDKDAVIADLAYGMRDPAGDVRNNALRALMVIAKLDPTHARPPRVPAEPFVGLLDSPVWTDRNKASLALMELTESRDPALLSRLRREAIEPLAEMARWKNEGHAMPALLILGRIAGRSDDEVRSAWSQGKRESIIDAALAVRG